MATCDSCDSPHGLSPNDIDLTTNATTGSDTLLKAVATVVRNRQSAVMHLASGARRMDVQFWPREHRYVCATDLAGLAPGDFLRLTLIRVGPSVAVDPPARRAALGPGTRVWPLAPLLWRLALHSGSGELLPEIDGPLAYRAAPGLLPVGLPSIPAAQALALRLRGQPATLDELSGRTVLGRARAKRLLNALHLQSCLIVSVHPPASGGGESDLKRFAQQTGRMK